MGNGEEVGGTLLLKVQGQPLPADVMALFVNGYVDDSTTVPDLFVLRFSDPLGIVLTKASISIGSVVELSAQLAKSENPVKLLVGEVTALEVELTQAGMHTIVRGLDKSHRLFRGTRVATYAKMTASDIVKKVAGRAGVAVKAEASGPVLEHVTQDGVSDWEFLRRLATETGAVLSMTDDKLEFVKATPATEAPAGRASPRSNPLVLEPTLNLVSLRGTLTSNGQVPTVEVRGWDPAQKRAVVAGKSATTLSASLTATPVSLAQKFDSPPYVASIPSITQQRVATAAAASLSDHVAGGFAELEGVARGNPKLRAGTAVQLTGVGEAFAGRYVLSSTRHDFSAEQGYLTSFVVSNTSERSLYGTTSGAQRNGRPKISGVVPALVTNIQDPEKLGRVKVKMPWLDEAFESTWARPVLPGAGAGRGMVVLPEVNDEVLVAFGQDDFQNPYILGGLYNGKDKPDKPWADHIDGGAGKIKRRAWASRKGMCVEFFDTDGQEKVQVTSNSGAQRITLLQTTKGIEIVSEGPIEITAKQGVNVTAKQDVKVTTGTGNVEIKGMNVKVEATTNLELKGAQVKLTGQATTEVSSSGVTTVRGSLVKIN